MHLLFFVPLYIAVGMATGLSKIRYGRFDVENDTQAMKVGLVTLLWPIEIGGMFLTMVGWLINELAEVVGDLVDLWQYRKRQRQHE